MTAEEERRLVLAAQKGDRAALSELLHAHRGFIWQQALKLQRRNRDRCGVELDDLLQVGRQSLIEQIPKFDASRGFRLLTYCGRGIYRRMLREIQDNQKFAREVPMKPGCEPGYETEPPLFEPEEFDQVRRAMRRTLNKRERYVLRERSKGRTLAAISEKLGIGKERVRQLWGRSIERVQEWIKWNV